MAHGAARRRAPSVGARCRRASFRLTPAADTRRRRSLSYARMVCVAQEDTRGADDADPRTDGSSWVVIARHTRDLRAVAPDPGWRDCRRSVGTAPWTDDHCSLLGALDLSR